MSFDWFMANNFSFIAVFSKSEILGFAATKFKYLKTGLSNRYEIFAKWGAMSVLDLILNMCLVFRI